MTGVAPGEFFFDPNFAKIEIHAKQIHPAGKSLPGFRYVIASRAPYALAAILLSASIACASPATFVTALPVARDQMIVRFNAQPLFSTRGLYGVQFPVNIGYGLTSRWALFANVNQGFASISTQRLNSSGVYDLLSYARYTLFKIDKPKSTFRVASIAGAYFPTGDNSLRSKRGLLPRSLQTGSGTVDPYAGVTLGYSAMRWGMAMDSTYRKNPVTHSGVSPADQYRADAQVEYKVLPLRMPDEGLPRLVVISIESNYVHDGKDHVNGLIAANSGGNILRQDAVLEMSTLRWQIGLGAQLPVMQDLTGTARSKQRSGFFLFFEYYLAAPNWRSARAHR